MSVTIRIDQDVYDSLKAKAEPFVDSPNSVLRRLLKLDGHRAAPSLAVLPPAKQSAKSPRTGKTVARPRKSKGRRRAKRAAPVARAITGSILPEERYELPILRALVAAGGSGPSREITAAAGRLLESELTDNDKAPLASGGLRWESRVQFVRLRLIERALMQRDTLRGIWAITEAGRQLVARTSQGTSA